MRTYFLRLNAFAKSFILLLRPHLFFGFLKNPFLFLSNTLALSQWIAKQQPLLTNDFYTPFRDHNRRYNLFTQVIDYAALQQKKIAYLEFGVSQAHSFTWWLKNNGHAESRFHGFDTFEGLPEQWGTFAKGAMAAGIPRVDDQRAFFYPGLFQHTVPAFLKETDLSDAAIRVIHLDADLFSATLFALTSLAPYLKKGDILFFDEFNVPNHEFHAFQLFCSSYYLEFELLGAVNNYYQVAFVLK